MCLFKKRIRNPRYDEKKFPETARDDWKDGRLLEIEIPCGNCIECRKQKQRDWIIRLTEESKEDNTGQFVTLTFSEEALKELEEAAETKEANKVAAKGVRRFLERWRWETGKSVKHWLITELGHRGTQRIHLHGILYTTKTKKEIEKIWQYGRIDVGYSMNEKVIRYVTKYSLKIDKDHPGFKGKIMASAGLGKAYLKKYDANIRNKYKEDNTDETYVLKNGTRVGMPKYYRDKIYDFRQREELRLKKEDEKKKYVLGVEIDMKDAYAYNNPEKYFKKWNELNNAMDYAREKSIRMGYGDGSNVKKYYTTTNNKEKELENKK